MTCDKCLYQPICDTYANFGVTDLPASFKIPCKLFKNKADFVEVVRCKDCKHKEKTTNEYCTFWYKFCAFDNNFCSYGERKVVTDTNVGGK